MGCRCGKGGGRSSSIRGMTYVTKTRSNRIGGLTPTERKNLEIQINQHQLLYITMV